jgi:hypothetical protein
MDAIQQAHVKMIITTRDVLDLNQALWQSIPAFVTARASLGTAITSINTEALNQSGTTTGGTADKHTARKILCDAAAVVGGAVAAWADTQNNHELFASVDFSAADLLHLPEQDCANACQAILDAGTANLAAIAAGKTLAQTDLDDLTQKLKNFNTALTRPRQLRSRMKGATDQLPALIAAADRILEHQIDRLMERFKAASPDFYSAYQVARIIVNQGGGASTATPPAPATQTAAPPAAAGGK